MVVFMDFELFMERYGYKLLLGLMALVVIVVVGIPILGYIYFLRRYSWEIGGLMLIIVVVYAFSVRRKVMDAYAQAHGKYFYDDKWYKRR
ncbi:hypothetical protein [Thermococcus barophilus]|nr:hypothetical protein [Thermococcus barophilus]